MRNSFDDTKYMSKGFTLIEMIVVIAIIAVLSAIILFSVTQYVNQSKDSNIRGNLVALIPAGEVYYNGNARSYGSSNSQNFCGSGMVNKVISQMPLNSTACHSFYLADNPAGLCCYVRSDWSSWAACAKEFTNPKLAFCVDSSGAKEEMCSEYFCNSNLAQCPPSSSALSHCP